MALWAIAANGKMIKTHHTHQCSASSVSPVAESVRPADAENTVVENFWSAIPNFWSAFCMRLFLAPLNAIFVLQFGRLASVKQKMRRFFDLVHRVYSFSGWQRDSGHGIAATTTIRAA